MVWPTACRCCNADFILAGNDIFCQIIESRRLHLQTAALIVQKRI
ncbi:hypothetical protein ANACOL_03406 [Anaerotruncus colihominis DSM 17241]|uniref:Uncharacterized protein n=1 Tax=Anaerotruncus colihominis DSM 17241 TaxID=445972 RepID=B0PF27_9FIRM|nr:hypothetical protein ANACOL_03406 [Anaerotruncus colihominis DSM 17241]